MHPVPGTEDGKPNQDFKRGIIASQPNGSEWVWQAPQMSDPFQGPAYHISKAKDAASGERWRRFERFLEACLKKREDGLELKKDEERRKEKEDLDSLSEWASQCWDPRSVSVTSSSLLIGPEI